MFQLCGPPGLQIILFQSVHHYEKASHGPK